MTQENVLIGIGNPLLDISAVVKPELLEKYGLKANDAILAEEKHMGLYDELVKDYKVEYLAGGSAQNTMRGAQWLLPAKSTVYIGCVGRDSEGQQLADAASKDGLRTEYLYDDSTPTGKCAVLITGNNRSMVTDLKAANNYKIEHLEKPEVWALVKNARFFYSTGFFLTVSPPSALKLAKHALEANKKFILNLSAPFIAQFFTKPLDEVLFYADIVFGNESEAEAFANAHDFKTKAIRDIAVQMAALPKANDKHRIVIITQGAEPTIVVQNGSIKEYPVIPIKKENIVDTNGAGDAFVGGFLSQFAQGFDIDQCIAAGNYVANVVIQRSGPSYPTESHSFKY